jgi:hypothetical protein
MRKLSAVLVALLLLAASREAGAGEGAAELPSP